MVLVLVVCFVSLLLAWLRSLFTPSFATARLSNSVSLLPLSKKRQFIPHQKRAKWPKSDQQLSSGDRPLFSTILVLDVRPQESGMFRGAQAAVEKLIFKSIFRAPKVSVCVCVCVAFWGCLASPSWKQFLPRSSNQNDSKNPRKLAISRTPIFIGFSGFRHFEHKLANTQEKNKFFWTGAPEAAKRRRAHFFERVHPKQQNRKNRSLLSQKKQGGSITASAQKPGKRYKNRV